MIAAIRIVSVTLNFASRDEQPFAVLPALSEDVVPFDLDLGRVTVRLIAARPCRVIRHKPGRVKLLVNCLVPGWVAMLLSQRLGEHLGKDHCRGRYHDKRKNERELMHSSPPIRRSLLLILSWGRLIRHLILRLWLALSPDTFGCRLTRLGGLAANQPASTGQIELPRADSGRIHS